jgi:hypothetical protein
MVPLALRLQQQQHTHARLPTRVCERGNYLARARTPRTCASIPNVRSCGVFIVVPLVMMRAHTPRLLTVASVGSSLCCPVSTMVQWQEERPFKVLGFQQVAIGALKKQVSAP